MSDVLLLYLFTRLDAVQFVIVGVSTVCLLAAVVALLGWCVEVDIERRPGKIAAWKRCASRFGAAAACGFVLFAFVPSSKGMAIILGGKWTIDALRSPEAKEVGGLLMDAVKAKLKDAAK